MAGTTAGAGTNQNGISNSGSSVGFTIDNDGNFHNFTVNPLKSNSATLLNINGSTTAMAFAANSKGTVVGTDGNGNAFTLTHGKVKTFIPRRHVRDRLRDQRQGNDRRPVRHRERDAGLHQGQ